MNSVNVSSDYKAGQSLNLFTGDIYVPFQLRTHASTLRTRRKHTRWTGMLAVNKVSDQQRTLLVRWSYISILLFL